MSNKYYSNYNSNINSITGSGMVLKKKINSDRKDKKLPIIRKIISKNPITNNAYLNDNNNDNNDDNDNNIINDYYYPSQQINSNSKELLSQLVNTNINNIDDADDINDIDDIDDIDDADDIDNIGDIDDIHDIDKNVKVNKNDKNVKVNKDDSIDKNNTFIRGKYKYTLEPRYNNVIKPIRIYTYMYPIVQNDQNDYNNINYSKLSPIIPSSNIEPFANDFQYIDDYNIIYIILIIVLVFYIIKKNKY